MNRTRSYLILLLFMAATVGAELWKRSAGGDSYKAQSRAAAQRIAALPETVGDWQTQERASLPQSAIDTLECSGYVQRRYVNAVTGQSVWVTVLAGPAGPMIAHRPEVCFPSQNFTLLEATKRVRIVSPNHADGDGADELHHDELRHDELHHTVFQSPDVTRSKVHAYYGWRRAAQWEAPTSPRWTLGGEPYLFKLQVVSTADHDRPAAEDAGLQFLHDCLPVFNRVLRH